MKARVLVLTAVFGLAAHASPRLSAHLTKTIPFPVSSLQKVEQAMQTAAARTGDAMKQDAFYDIDSNTRVRCTQDDPISYKGHLYGCVLQMSVDLGGGATALMQNMLYPTQSASEVQALLENTDASKVDRVQLATPFDGGNGSSYFCNAEGSPRSWVCYLTFVD